ncbi:MAG: virulence factor [Anaerolineae bacterium]|nr:virulence factor [Anaerolineae bacterium]
MTTVKVMYWKDIPCTVRAEAGRRQRVSRPLPDIYMAVVDAVAMKEGLTGSDAYQDAFHWGEAEERDGTVAEAADAVVEEILAKYPKSWLIERGQQAGASIEDETAP